MHISWKTFTHTYREGRIFAPRMKHTMDVRYKISDISIENSVHQEQGVPNQ